MTDAFSNVQGTQIRNGGDISPIDRKALGAAVRRPSQNLRLSHVMDVFDTAGLSWTRPAASTRATRNAVVVSGTCSSAPQAKVQPHYHLIQPHLVSFWWRMLKTRRTQPKLAERRASSKELWICSHTRLTTTPNHSMP